MSKGVRCGPVVRATAGTASRALPVRTYAGAVGLATDLSFRHRPPNPVQRALQKVASTERGARLASRFLPATDKAVHRLTGGKVSIPSIFSALPVMMVTTTGRRSGLPRTSPLAVIPVGEDDLALLGTNFGGANTPAWALNLEADPRCEVEHRGRRRPAVARPATEDEREAVWREGARIYGGYESYQERITDRDVRIFVLETATPGTDE